MSSTYIVTAYLHYLYTYVSLFLPFITSSSPVTPVSHTLTYFLSYLYVSFPTLTLAAFPSKHINFTHITYSLSYII